MRMPLNLTTDENAWDEFCLAHGGNFLQSWGWSQFQEAAGAEVFRVRLDAPEGEDDGQTTIAQFLLLGMRLPLGLKYLYVPRGPVVSGSEPLTAKGRFEACLGAVRDAMRRQGAFFARLEPPQDLAASPLSDVDLKFWGLRQTISRSPECTAIVDLTRSEEDLLAGMKPKTRYNIRVAEKHGVTVGDAAYANAHLLKHDVDVFWRLMSETTERDGFRAHERGDYEKMIDVLNPRRHKGGLLVVRLMFATHDGEAVAAGLFAEYGDTVTYLHGASLSAKRQVMAPYALHWGVMREAKARGFKKYDLWGVAPSDEDTKHPWAGITRFKMGFGGARVSYPGTWDLPRSSWTYALYKLMRKIRRSL
jgi:lipid II:glycine glycyltransferase (peptidoglycan interpeptide bridge formation enzyme)